MNTLPETTTPVTYFAQYTAPDGDMLYGTATATPLGWIFTDELGATPFYTDKRALTLCGQVTLVQAQAVTDGATLWVNHLLRTGCQVA